MHNANLERGNLEIRVTGHTQIYEIAGYIYGMCNGTIIRLQHESDSCDSDFLRGAGSGVGGPQPAGTGTQSR